MNIGQSISLANIQASQESGFTVLSAKMDLSYLQNSQNESLFALAERLSHHIKADTVAVQDVQMSHATSGHSSVGVFLCSQNTVADHFCYLTVCGRDV